MHTDRLIAVFVLQIEESIPRNTCVTGLCAISKANAQSCRLTMLKSLHSILARVDIPSRHQSSEVGQ